MFRLFSPRAESTRGSRECYSVALTEKRITEEQRPTFVAFAFTNFFAAWYVHLTDGVEDTIAAWLKDMGWDVVVDDSREDEDEDEDE